MTEDNADILPVSETQLNDSVPSAQLKRYGFSTLYRYYRDLMGGGLVISIRDGIPTKYLKHDFGTNIDNLSVEIDLRKKKSGFPVVLNIRIKTKF